MSNPYRLTPGRLPAPPHPTPTSVSGYTFANSKVGRAPIANPYDKFTQPEFDAWIGGITGALKHALGHDEGPVKQQSLSEGGDIPQFRPIDLPEDSDNDGVDDSFAEIKARRAAGKGKARDPREGPGLGKTSVAQPIEIPSSDEEEEEEVEYSILHQNDSDAEEEAEDGEAEAEEDEEYPWSTAQRPQGIGSSPPSGMIGEVDVDNDDYDEDEEVEYEEYGEEAESEGEQQEQGRPEDAVIELLSDDDEEPPTPPGRSRPATVEEERYDDEEYFEEEDEEYGAEDVEEDEDQEDVQDHEDARARQRVQHVVEDDEDEIVEVQPLEDDSSFPPQAAEPLATTPTRGAASMEIPGPWNGLQVYARDYYSGGELQRPSEQRDPSYLGAEDEVDDGNIAQISFGYEQAEAEFQYPDAATAAETTPVTGHDLSQHAGHTLFVNQAENAGHLGPSNMPPQHIRSSASPFMELSFDRKLVEPVEEHYIQPSDEDTSFPMRTGEGGNHLVQIPDPWDGPREYAQDFYAGGNIQPTPWAHIDVDHLAPEDEDHAEESRARKEQEAEDDEIQPQGHDTAFLHDGVRAGAVEIPDPWQGPQTYAQDYYSGGVNGALPTDRIDPALLSVTGEIDDGYSSFLTPFTLTPSHPVDTEGEDNEEDEGEDHDKFALPPAPEGIYVPPGLQARDAPIPTDAEIFNVDDSDDEEVGKPVPIREYTRDEDHNDDVDYELEYVDKDIMDETENVVLAAEVASHDTHDQSELALEQNQQPEDLATPEESKEVLSSLVDWNNPPAFSNGFPASASGHLATPSSEGEDLIVAEHPVAIDAETEIEEVVAQDDGIVTEKGQRSPPLADVAETLFQQLTPELEVEFMSEATNLTAIASGDPSTPSVDVTDNLPEETDIVQAPEKSSAHSTVVAGDLGDPVVEDVSEDVLDIDQSIPATADVREPTPPFDSQDDESKVTELEAIVEEVPSVVESRAGTVPLPDLTLEELDHHALITDEKDTHLVIGIVEHKEATASPRETPHREILTVEVVEEYTEHAFVSHADSAPPISILPPPARYDDLSYEDYASSVEVDELDEEGPEILNEGVPSSKVELSVEKFDAGHIRADDQTLALVLGDVISPTNAEIGSGAPFDPTIVKELSEGQLHRGALSPYTDDTATLQVEDSALPPSLYSAGERRGVDVADTPAGNELPPHFLAGADLMITENDMLTDDFETEPPAAKIPSSEAPQTTERTEPSSLPADSPSDVLHKKPEADDVKRAEDLDRHVHASSARSKTPIQEHSPPSLATPEKASTNKYPEAVFSTPERYTPSPPKAAAPEALQASSVVVSDSVSRNKPFTMSDVGGIMWAQEDLQDIAQAISPNQTQPMRTMNGTSATNHHQLTSAPPELSEPPSSEPQIFLDNQLEHLRTQYGPNIDNSMLTTIANAESISRHSREPPQQSSFSQTPLLHAPVNIEQFHRQILHPLSGSWPYSLSAPGTQQLSTSVDSPASSLPKGRKKPRAAGASPRSPKKGKKAVQLKKTHMDDPSLELQYPSDTDRKQALSHTVSEFKTTTPQDEPLKSNDVAQPFSGSGKLPVKETSEDWFGQGNPVKNESLPPVPGTTAESSSTISKVGGAGAPKQELQKPKRTYKRKRDMSPGPGGSQVGKTDEKKKRPTKRKSKLLELEGPIPGPSNGETIHVKAKPGGTSPAELSQTNAPTTSKGTITKPKRGRPPALSTSLPGSSASQVIKPELLLITSTGIGHRHGPPAVPSFKALPPKTTSPRKHSLPQTLGQTQPLVVAQPGLSSTPESANLTSSPNISTMPEAIPPTHPTQPIEATPTESPTVSTAPGLPEVLSGNIQTLPTPTTETPAQLPEITIAPSDPETPSNIIPASTKSALPSNLPTVPPVTASTLTTPSALVARSMTASVGNTPMSQAGTPTTTMRETRSSCRYHRISLPKEEGGPRVRFLVPGCAMTNHILMKEQEIVDHGLAPQEDAFVMIKDIESLDLGSDLISVLRVLVGHDIFRDQELFYLPAPGEQLSVKPAFRKPTPSGKLESSHHHAGSPSYSSLAGSPTFHKSSTSVSGSTSSLSALRKAQASEWSSNIAPTDSEGDSEDGDAHSKTSDHKGKGKSRAKSGRKSKLGPDPDFVPAKEEGDKLSDAEGLTSSTRKRRKPTGAKRGVKRTRTEAPGGEDSSHQNKKLKAHSTEPPSLASPEKPAPPDAPLNNS
ncbi:hypothetical protein D9619_001977 [Psilocybe cf. subviscida]|uniref:Uncharacterized protein n=1 Tax=Psilocybe cf. subviscida TaxID=2480587 RepID=A0A8H5BGL8_9AGAR|nr:hypothetical protein D9619_001977 [Psilocybe cf. subviscida]